MSADLLEDIKDNITWHKLRQGEVLFEQGAQGDDLAVVITGRLQVSLQKGGTEKILNEIYHGEMVGEYAV